MLFPNDSSSQQLPPFPELEVNVLSESSQLTNMMPVVGPSFVDLTASASSRNRRRFVCHPTNGEEVCSEDRGMRWRCKRRKSFVSGADRCGEAGEL